MQKKENKIMSKLCVTRGIKIQWRKGVIFTNDKNKKQAT